MSKKLVTITRRTALVLSAVAIVSVIVSASILASYLLPSRVNVNTVNGVQDCTALGSTLNGNCQLLGPSQTTSPITVSLAVDSTASTGVVTFTEVYQVFDSVNG